MIMENWQPMETAPKDGSLLLLVYLGKVGIGSWNSAGNYWAEYPDEDWISQEGDGHVSKWMPLPSP